MKNVILLFDIALKTTFVKGKSCDKIVEYVKKGGGYESTYTNYNSDAISKVTFYQMTVYYKTLYFAIVFFNKEYSYSCSEYLYKVGLNTKLNYSMNYLNSKGKAFCE